MDSKGKKVALLVVLVAMLAATGFIIYTSRQAASAKDNPGTHAARINRAAEEVEHLARP